MRFRRWVVGAWILAVAAAGLVVARAHYTADLSAFLPDAPTAAQRLLIAQLKEGPASRVLLVAIEGADAATRAVASRELAQRLRADPRFGSVQNGAAADNPADRDYVFRHRYLLSERVDAKAFAPPTLRARIAETVDLLASPLGLMAKDLFRRDPTGETLAVIAQMDRPDPPSLRDGVWTSRDGTRALLVVELRASGSDTDAQQAALAAIRDAFATELAARSPGLPGLLRLRMTGPAMFAVEARATIQREALRLSAISSAIIVLFLLAVYRSPTMLLLGMLPVASGALAGVAAVALGFGTVHGVTLGFGVTLIGEAVDYSVYLFLQGGATAGEAATTRWTREFWPTVRLGMLTSVVGFASLLPSSFPGLAQLGCYTIAGLLAAGLVTRFVLPSLVGASPPRLGVDALGRAILGAIGMLRRLRPLVWGVALAALSIVLVRGDALWNRELAALSPVPAAARAFDAALRADLGVADAGTLVVVTAPTAEDALAGAEAAGQALQGLVAAGVIGGFESPSRYLPSMRAQRARQASLPDAVTLRRAFDVAVRDLPLRAGQFEGFAEDVEVARHQAPVTADDVAATSMGPAVRALLLRDGAEWNALLPLQAVRAAGRASGIDLTRVAAAMAACSAPPARLVVLDLKHESDALYGGYLTESVRLSLCGLGAILLLLAASLRSVPRILRVLLPLVVAVLCVTAGFALLRHPMTILNLVGLLLTVAVGSNYALFFDRKAGGGEAAMAARTVASLAIANLTTVIGFGVLATSSVPVLADVGATVAPGAFLALVFSAMLASPGAATGARP